MIIMLSLVTVSTVITYFFPNTFLSHFCAIKNSLKLTKDYASPYMRRVRFLDGFKFYYHNGACFAHLAAFLPVAPLMFGTMQELGETMDNMWLLTQYTKKAFYVTQIIFFVRYGSAHVFHDQSCKQNHYSLAGSSHATSFTRFC